MEGLSISAPRTKERKKKRPLVRWRLAQAPVPQRGGFPHVGRLVRPMPISQPSTYQSPLETSPAEYNRRCFVFSHHIGFHQISPDHADCKPQHARTSLSGAQIPMLSSLRRGRLAPRSGTPTAWTPPLTARTASFFPPRSQSICVASNLTSFFPKPLLPARNIL